ncbi:Potassium uptake protein, TrkH family [Pseudodesulfovibrio profundus]|uniref:Potassium uptake protein, TrkH family n=1 Tax=Pseudodesulfovibrio profundus TaxID=57320 RepID=A0A2C8F645_9BACT|nr:potassium transporter TrkG [Pseudodesulfovibrio profundus]SOB57505.1 Potassium uptake protein, TrkH family [Pseudodesulfovibrio profundus]
MALSPCPLALPFLGLESVYPQSWQLIISAIAAISCLVCALTIFRRPLFGKVLGAGASVASYITAFPYLSTSPFAALTGSVGLVFVAAMLFDFDIRITGERSNHVERCLQRARWAALTVPAVVVVSLPLELSASSPALYIFAASSLIAQSLFLHWAVKMRSKPRIALSAIGILAIVLLLLWPSAMSVAGMVGIVSLINLMMIPSYRNILEREDHWWDVLVNHPGRILFTTFFILCTVGSLLLTVPASTENGAIDLVDAIFTSVSAVCVTGLVVLDTPNDFTLVGQIFILLLIQLGGLGIMSITTVALQAMGRRLSLKHERLLASMTDTNHQDLIRALATILKFTLLAEGLGALSLTMLFYASGDQFSQALWRGLFTAVSAFCNAGFALQTDSLIPYQANPFVLHIVAGLIVFGGMAPATSLIVPKWVRGKPVPISARIALITTVALLIAGTFFVLAFEWNGVLGGLSIVDKIQNAWFQSVTLRTAGFNSVDIANISSPTLLIMIAFMFIGGSPGGTAGGVKTTTIGILAMTFWSNVTNQNQIITQNRRIHSGTIYRAVTVLVSGMAIWFVVVLMLQVTQEISSRDLIFEATSAIGTVGLSTGATPLLDEIGKVIIIIAMFAGRIGPITLFMLLNDDQAVSDTRHPVESVSIT